MSSIYYGIDIGGTFVKICMYSVDGIERSFVDKWSIPTDTSDHGEHILDDITASIRKACEDNHISFGDVKGIGIGVPGPVTDEGTVLKCVNLGWGVFSIKEKMIELTGLHNIVAANDANVAALGETWMGSGAGYENLVMVTSDGTIQHFHQRAAFHYIELGTQLDFTLQQLPQHFQSDIFVFHIFQLQQKLF